MSRRATLKTARVNFCALDYYTVEPRVGAVDTAIDKAKDLYNRHGEKPFTFDLSQGGTDHWEAHEVTS